jgi:hypothetical protein
MNTRRTLTILGLDIPVNSRMPEADFQQCISLLEERIDAVSAQIPVKDPVKAAVLVALNLAGELVQTRKELPAQLDLLCGQITDHLKE